MNRENLNLMGNAYNYLKEDSLTFILYRLCLLNADRGYISDSLSLVQLTMTR